MCRRLESRNARILTQARALTPPFLSHGLLLRTPYGRVVARGAAALCRAYGVRRRFASRRPADMASSRWRRFADRHPRAAERLVGLRPFLPPLNFITIHYAYFIGVCLVFSLVFWGSSSPAMSISYTDSLFLVVSGMSEAGLNTVNLSQITTWQQFILFLLIIVGSSIWVSIWTVLFRKHVFEQRCDAIVRAHRMRRLSRGSLTFSRTFSFGRRPADRSTSSDSTAVATLASEATATAAAPAYAPPAARAVMAEDASAPGETEPARRQDDDADGDGADDEDAIRPAAAAAPAAATGRVAFAADLDSAGGRSTAAAVSPDYADGRPTRRFNRNGGPGQTAGDDEKPGLFSSRTIGRNAQFHNLSTKEREQLGGCEYRAPHDAGRRGAGLLLPVAVPGLRGPRRLDQGLHARRRPRQRPQPVVGRHLQWRLGLQQLGHVAARPQRHPLREQLLRADRHGPDDPGRQHRLPPSSCA